MSEQKIILSFPDSDKLFEVLSDVQNRISILEDYIIRKANSGFENMTLLTREEVAKLFKINISTVRNWSKSGILLPYYCGDRVYFKHNEVLKALIPSNINIQKK